MIEKFLVQNYKNFDSLELDLTAKEEYEFNANWVRHGVVEGAIIYGNCASGKSNLGYALTDVKQNIYKKVNKKIINFENDDNIFFEYHFLIGGEKIVYKYTRNYENILQYERIVWKNGIITYWHENDVMEISIKLNRKKIKVIECSILQYFQECEEQVHENEIMFHLIEFIKNIQMIEYAKAGQDLKNIYCEMDLDKLSKVNTFENLANCRFVFVDNSDLYGIELPIQMIEYMRERNVQWMLTAQRTRLISNRLLRPDCYFLVKNNQVKSFHNLTKKRLVQKTNLEKLFVTGGFES